MKTIRTIADFQPALSLDDRRINVDPETRRIAVRVARWEETHSGFGEKVRIPRKVNVDAAHVGVTELGDGVTMRVATLPMETMHAPRDLAALHAASWYENSGKGLAKVRYSVDDEGIRADGVLFDDIDDSTIDRVLAASASGDWRSAVAIKRFSDFERVPADFVGSCIVNVPGFSDTFTQASGQKFALAASAHSILSFEDEVALTAAATSTDAVRNAAMAAYAGDSEEVAYDLQVLDVLIDPSWVIVMDGNDTYAHEWTAADNGAISLGAAMKVRSEWLPVDEDGGTMTASAGDGCNGECETCTCSDPKATVTLSASAVTALLAGDASDEVKGEVQAALVAGGLAEAPDPVAERLERIEKLVTGLIFND